MSADPSTAPQDWRLLDIDDIVPNDQNPRLVFPRDELDALAESIDQQGIILPLVVYKKGGKFVLVDGERRFRCALELGLAKVPAVVTTEKSGLELLEQMFNIHLIREPWQDMPTANALRRFSEEIKKNTGNEPSDDELKAKTGLSIERIRRLRYVVTLPSEWQEYVAMNKIPLNFFWELKRNVVDPLARLRPDLLKELDQDRVMNAFVGKRLSGVITDTVSLRLVAPIIRYSAEAKSEGVPAAANLDKSIRDLVLNAETTIDEVYQDSVQTMVEVDKLERRTASMVAAFSRLLLTSATDEERAKVRAIGEELVRQLQGLLGNGARRDGQAI